MSWVKKIPFTVIISLFFVLIFLFYLHPISGDGDFFHDLSTGKYILAQHRIPRVDEYTFTARGRPWVANAWATGVLYYELYSLNPVAISLFTGLVAMMFFILVYFWLRTYEIKPWIILLTIAFGAPIIAIRWSDRPEMFTYLFLSALFLVDAYHRQRPKLLFLLPILFFIWSILYVGSVFVGLGLVCLLLVKRLVQDRFSFTRQVYIYCGCIILSLFATFFNGNGMEGLVYITKIPIIAKTSGEWLGIFPLLQQVQIIPLLLLQYRIILYFLYLLVFFVLLLLCIIFNRRIFKKYPFLCIISLGIFAPFFAIRNIPLSIFLPFPLIGIMLTEVLKRFKLYVFIPFIVAICVSILISYWVSPIGFGQDDATYSPEVISFLRANHVTGNIFADQSISPFLTFALYPKILIYADTRDDLYLGTPILSTLNDLFYYGGNPIPLLNHYNVTTVVADATTAGPFDNLLYSPDWKLVFVNGNYYIFIRNGSNVSNFPSFSGIDLSSNSGAKPGEEEVALNEYKMLLQKYPQAFNIRYGAAKLYFSMKNPTAAISLAQSLRSPEGPFAPVYSSKRDSLLAVAYLITKQCANAKQAVDDLHNDVTGKFLFDKTKTLPSTSDEDYMYYYLTCDPNYSKAQSHLQNLMNDPSVSNAEKQHAKNIFSNFTNGGTR